MLHTEWLFDDEWYGRKYKWPFSLRDLEKTKNTPHNWLPLDQEPNPVSPECNTGVLTIPPHNYCCSSWVSEQICLSFYNSSCSRQGRLIRGCTFSRIGFISRGTVLCSLIRLRWQLKSVWYCQFKMSHWTLWGISVDITCNQTNCNYTYNFPWFKQFHLDKLTVISWMHTSKLYFQP